MGVAVSSMGRLPVSRFLGSRFDSNVAAVVAKNEKDLPAIWCYCKSPEYHDAVRAMDQALKVTNASLVKISFDLAHWQKVAAEKYPHGLPKPFSSDPTQWLFNGHPAGAAVHRLVDLLQQVIRDRQAAAIEGGQGAAVVQGGGLGLNPVQDAPMDGVMPALHVGTQALLADEENRRLGAFVEVHQDLGAALIHQVVGLVDDEGPASQGQLLAHLVEHLGHGGRGQNAHILEDVEQDVLGGPQAPALRVVGLGLVCGEARGARLGLA